MHAELWAVRGSSYRAISSEQDLQDDEMLHTGDRPEFPVDHIAEAEACRTRLINSVQESISLIKIKLLAGRKPSPEEVARLNVVLDYIDTVQETDISAAPDITWPAPPFI